MPDEFQLVGYLRLLAEHDVAYLIVGGVGGRIQGAATTTGDIDIMPDPSPANLARLASALSGPSTEKKEASSTVYEVHENVDPMEFRTADVPSYRTAYGLIDVLIEVPGVGPFDAVRRNARRYQSGDIVLIVASIDDIITSKETTGRSKDWRAMDALYQARDHLRDHPDPYDLSDHALDDLRRRRDSAPLDRRTGYTVGVGHPAEPWSPASARIRANGQRMGSSRRAEGDLVAVRASPRRHAP